MKPAHRILNLESRGSEANPSLIREAAPARAHWSDYLELTKPRLSVMSVITALVGYLAANSPRDGGVLLSLLLGTSLAAGGAAALNQWWERKTDSLMARTRRRPIPAGAVDPRAALAFGLAISLAGTAVLYFGARPLSALLALLTIAGYILVYTPLKRLTVRNTIVGAVPGAIPPLIGWTAATGSFSDFGWILFALLFTWQMPHFYAIAWTYRKDYAGAGYRMLPHVDPTGRRTARESLLFTCSLVLVSLSPAFLGFTSPVYGCVALAAGCALLRRSYAFAAGGESRDRPARKLFLASVFYLPLVLAALLLDILLIG